MIYYRAIHEELFRSPAFRSLPIATKYTYLVLVIQGGLTGVIQKTYGELASFAELTPKAFRRALKELQSPPSGAPWVAVDDEAGLIWVIHQIDDQIVKKAKKGRKKISSDLVEGMLKDLSILPKSPILQQVKGRYKHVFELVADPDPPPDPPPQRPPDLPGERETEKEFELRKEKKASEEGEKKEKPEREEKGEKDSRHLGAQLETQLVELARSVYSQQFGRPISPTEVLEFAFGVGRNGRDCFGSLGALIKFWESLPCSQTDPLQSTRQCTLSPECIARFQNWSSR